MTAELLNRDLLPSNTCFGCGPENPHGLRIAITRDGSRTDRLVGTLDPAPHMVGFPGITHGGAIYAALDCIAAWVPMVLRPEGRAIWILRSANITYRRPAPIGQRIGLSGVIAHEGTAKQPMTVHAEARDPNGVLLAEADFKVVPLSASRFKEVSGVQEIPENWLRLMGESIAEGPDSSPTSQR